MEQIGFGTGVRRYRCRGCGRLDSIVSVEVVPRMIAVRPGSDGPDFVPEQGDEAAWESSLTLGYACRHDDCPFWEARYGVTADRTVTGSLPFAIVEPPGIDLVAEVIERPPPRQGTEPTDWT